jgi:hypothetical protein
MALTLEFQRRGSGDCRGARAGVHCCVPLTKIERLSVMARALSQSGDAVLGGGRVTIGLPDPGCSPTWIATGCNRRPAPVPCGTANIASGAHRG